MENHGKYLLRVGLVIILLGLMSLIYAPNANASPIYIQQIPPNSGLEMSCNLCHDAMPGLNQFGKDFVAAGKDFGKLLKKEEPENNAPAPVTETAPAPVAAQENSDAKIELIIPSGSVARGDKIQLQAKVTVNGEPVKGKQVQFFAEADFFLKGKMNLGETVTNADGVASISYWPRATEDKVNLSAVVTGENQIIIGEANASLSLLVAGPLAKPAEGLKIPFLGVWTIGLIVGGVWASYFYAGYRVLEIRKLAKVREQEAVHVEEERKQTQA
jgi:hypothetical protein